MLVVSNRSGHLSTVRQRRVVTTARGRSITHGSRNKIVNSPNASDICVAPIAGREPADGVAKKQQPIDDLIDAFVWMRRKEKETKKDAPASSRSSRCLQHVLERLWRWEFRAARSWLVKCGERDSLLWGRELLAYDISDA